MGFIEEALMRFAQVIVNQVIDTMAEQIQAVMTKVQNPLMTMIGGSLQQHWSGGSADEFKRQVNDILKQDLDPNVQYMRKFQRGISDAATMIVNADKQAQQLVGDLNNEFSKIY